MSYPDFMMKLQESVLNEQLPKGSDARRRFRQITVRSLSDVVSSLVTYLEPAIVLEIGAHAAEFSRSVKGALPNSRVVAFEANPNVYDHHHDDVMSTGVEYVEKCIADENKNYTFKFLSAIITKSVSLWVAF